MFIFMKVLAWLRHGLEAMPNLVPPSILTSGAAPSLWAGPRSRAC